MIQTTTSASLHAYFGYRDAPAAIEWLGRAFGFETTMQFPDGDGGVAHAELRLGDACIALFSDRDGYERAPRRGETAGFGAYVCLPEPVDVDATHARAMAAGATQVWAAEWSEWGNYRCRVLDIEGFEWTFGTHRPGQPAPDDWSESAG